MDHEANSSINNNPVVANADSNSFEFYPSASAVLIDDDDTTPLPHQPLNYSGNQNVTAHAPSTNNYASAQVVGSEISPFSHQLAVATNTSATATALDPWYKPPPTSSTEVTTTTNHHDNNRNATTNSASFIFDDDAPTLTIRSGSVVLEDPSRKKIRRRRRRRMRMVVSGATGFVVGSLFLGPIGAVAGAATGATIARVASKSGERRKDKRVQQRILQMQQQRH